MAIDLRKCATIVNPRFIPYLEKHRIYELFYDLGEALAMALPHDHVLYLRKLLADLAEVRGRSRIMLIVPPQISGRALATYIVRADRNLRIIGIQDLMEDGEQDITMEQLADRFNDIVAEESLAKKGWIVYDLPRTSEEAAYLQKQRILPTHTFEICASPEKYHREDAWCQNTDLWEESELDEAMAAHKRRVFGLKRALQSTYKQVPVEGRGLEDLSEEICKLARVPVSKGAPLVPRITLVGTRGSLRRTVASRLHKNLNVIHVDLEELMLGGLNLQNEIGDKLRRFKEKGIPVPFNLILSMIQKRLLQTDCMNHGWVLTGFPRDLGDLVALDSLDTPPNKVVFLSVSNEKALERLERRRVNAYDGRVRYLEEIKADPLEDLDEYYTHPRDLTENVFQEQEEFARNVQDMLEYCGDNCELVDAGDDLEEVIAERVARLVTQQGPIEEVRSLQRTGLQRKDSAMAAMRYTLVSLRGTSATYPDLLDYSRPSTLHNME